MCPYRYSEGDSVKLTNQILAMFQGGEFEIKHQDGAYRSVAVVRDCSKVGAEVVVHLECAATFEAPGELFDTGWRPREFYDVHGLKLDRNEYYFGADNSLIFEDETLKEIVILRQPGRATVDPGFIRELQPA